MFLYSNIPSISPVELKTELSSTNPPLLLDVRENNEVKISSLPFSYHIPTSELEKMLNEIPKETNLVVYCRTGSRSKFIVQELMKHQYNHVRNLTGGIVAWSQEIDPSMEIY